MTPAPTDGLRRAFDRLAARALAPDGTDEEALEAAAIGVALAELDLLALARGRERVASRVRKVLLGAAKLRAAAADEDARDAIELAIDQARRGAALLAGAPLSSLDGPPAAEPTPGDVARLLRGELDGFAAAEVALRLHRSGTRERYRAFLPERASSVLLRLAADSAPTVRDPSTGRSLGSTSLGDAALEAFAFEGGVIAIYAEPALGLTLVSIDAPLTSRPGQTAGYLELSVEGDPSEITLALADGERRIHWALSLR